MSDHPPARPQESHQSVSLGRHLLVFTPALRSWANITAAAQQGRGVLFFVFLIEFCFSSSPEPSESDGRLRAEFLYLFILFSLPFEAQLLILVSFPPLLSSVLLFPLFSFTPPIIFH